MAASEGPGSVKPVRADARRNHYRMVTAARLLFAAQGVTVPDELIATQAGLGVGTLHRHFPDRTALIEGVLAADQAALAEQSAMLLGSVMPANALATWLRAVAAALVNLDRLLAGVPDPATRDRLRLAAVAEWDQPTTQILTRALSAGASRDATNAGDLLALLDAIVRAGGGADHPGRTDRLLAIMLDGLRPQATLTWPGVPVQPLRPELGVQRGGRP